MRTIDADKLDSVFRNIFDHLYESGKADLAGTLAAFMDIVNRQPTIDAVPVVRCKDCVWFKESKGKDSGKFCGYGECKKPHGIRVIVCTDDFCSYGERKENTND